MAESAERILEQAKRKRVVQRRMVTKLVNKINKLFDEEEEISSDTLDNLMEQIETKYSSLKVMNNEIENTLFDDEELESDMCESEGYEEKIINCKARIKRAMRPNIDIRVNRRMNSTASDETVLGSESQRLHQPTMTTRLPKLELKKFYGEHSKWMEFWPQYEVAVHKNETQRSVDKFVYLKSYLGGTALSSITGLTLSDGNYEEAIRNLTNRFGQKVNLRNIYTNRLLDIIPVKRSSDIASLRRLYDQCEIEVRSLINLGEAEGKSGGVIGSIILKLVPPDISLEYCRRKQPEAEDDVSQILEFIRHEVESRERCLSYTQEYEDSRKHAKPSEHKPYKSIYKTPSNQSAAALNTTSHPVEVCLFCDDENHKSENCSKVEEVEYRKAVLKKKGRCFICVNGRHLARECRVKTTCTKCLRRHHISVCSEYRKPEERTNGATVVSATTLMGKNTILLQTAIAKITYGKREKLVRILLDGGSLRTFIKRKTSQELGLPVVAEELLHIHAFGGEDPEPVRCRRVKVSLTSLYNNKTIDIEAVESPEITSALVEVPGHAIRKMIGSKGFQLADQVPKNRTCGDELIILIGADYYWKIMSGNIERLNENLVAIESELGWLVHGPSSVLGMQVVSQSSTVLVSKIIANEDDISKILRAHWELESIGITETGVQPTILDEETVGKLEKGIRFVNGRYEAPLLWKDHHEELSSNYVGAKRRLLSLTRRFKRDPLLLFKYQTIIDDYFQKGMIELVRPETPPLNNTRLFYLPHQPVIKEERSTTKVRIVFDGSSHDPGSPSLNDCLLSGPNVNPDLLDVLTRFRIYMVAFIADVEQAFLQVSLKKEDQDSVRFLWSRNPLASEKGIQIETYRFTRIPFGTTSSPFLLAGVIRFHLRKYKGQYEDTCQKINEDLYVDDFISGAHNDDDAIRHSKEAKTIFKDASMSLRKWHTNSGKLEENWKGQGWQEITTEKVTFSSPCTLKVLGLSWDKSQDIFIFNVEGIINYLSSLRNTKRCVLSAAARVFDPLGLITPFTITVKILFQAIWEKECSWDEPLPEDLTQSWKSWCRELPKLNELKIPRHYLPPVTNYREASLQLNCFTDASQRAYGACLYLRCTSNDGHSYVSLVGSKSRVAPLKALTIPILELMGALIGSRLMNRLKINFKDKEPDLYFWSDSAITIHWIKGESSRWKQFVSNRVNEILRFSEKHSWNHCPGSENPADCLSRGQNAEEFRKNQLWWSGPRWLSLTEDHGPKNQLPVDEKEVIQELRANHLTISQHVCNVENIEPILNLNDSSSLRKIIRVTAWIFRYLKNLRKLKEHRNLDVLTTEELKRAENYWIQQTQREIFPEVIRSLKLKEPLSKNSTLIKYNPFLDEEGIIRIGGRLQHSELSFHEKHPIILPAGHRFSELQIDLAHEKVMHSGITSTLTQVRERFWILKSRQQIKNRINKCLICKRLRVKPVIEDTAPLPSDRVNQAKPFEVTGLDFAGPIYTKDQNERRKSYIALFTCGETRALHLELVSDMSAKSFLQSFRRFISRRGLVKVVYSDNAKSFQRADREFKLLWKRISVDEVKDFFGHQGVVWKYIVERAPWWGGFYERLVRSIKSCLKRILGQAFLDFEEITTVLTEVEAVLNSRPITYVNDESNEEPLTPAHFLIGRRVLSLPPATQENINFSGTRDELRRRWKFQEKLITQFWTRWRKEYILELRSAHEISRRTSSHYIQPGELALLRDDNVPRHIWKLVRVEEVFRGRDGKIRSCSIRLPSKVILKRPVNLICPLEI